MKIYVKSSNDWKDKEGIVVIEPGLGFSEKTQKYWGWSHRAYFGFGIGHVVEEGDVMIGYNGIKPGFKCKTLADCKKVAKAFAESVS